MKFVGLVLLVTAIALYGLHTQSQIDELQAALAKSVPEVKAIAIFDGGRFIEVDLPKNAEVKPVSSLDFEESQIPLVEQDVPHEIGDFIPVGSVPLRQSSAGIRRSIGEFISADDRTDRPDSLVQPMSVGEYIPVDDI